MTMKFPATRMRRLRANNGLRAMVRETCLSPQSLVLPMFVRAGQGVAQPVEAMPGVFQYSVDRVVEEAGLAAEAGVGAVLLFGIPDYKDAIGSSGYDPEGVVQTAVRALKAEVPELVVVTDVCLCAYMEHGHCGVVEETPQGFRVDNDRTLPLLAKIAASHAAAGADIVAPSDMMDGRVGAIRHELDRSAMHDVAIMSYSAKYASSFYGPFREAAESPPAFGDRRSYQMDPANSDEAMREIALDLDEGADMVMVKPALAYMDIIYRAKERFGCPLAVYNVSGEYSMVKAAGAAGWLAEQDIMLEMLTGFKRAGADIIITYFALDAARLL